MNIAYQVVGDGPLDLVMVPGFVSHIEVMWEQATYAHFLSRLASFSRLIVFDKRGTGMSDPVMSPPTMEERTSDIHAVMDAAGSRRGGNLGGLGGRQLGPAIRPHPSGDVHGAGAVRGVGAADAGARLSVGISPR